MLNSLLSISTIVDLKRLSSAESTEGSKKDSRRSSPELKYIHHLASTPSTFSAGVSKFCMELSTPPSYNPD